MAFSIKHATVGITMHSVLPCQVSIHRDNEVISSAELLRTVAQPLGLCCGALHHTEPLATPRSFADKLVEM